MTGFWQDVRYGIRRLAGSPGMTIASVALLALGIGANTAVFSLIDAILRRPLPGVEQPERLVRIVSIRNGQQQFNSGYPDYADFRDQSKLLSGVAAEGRAALNLGQDPPRLVRGAPVSGNYFSVLGVRPLLGRLFTPEDDRIPGAHFVAVISHAFWARVFGSDPTAVGKSVRLNGYAFTVIGVAAPEFQGTAVGESTDVWVPLMMQPQAIPRMSPGILRDRSAGWISLYARLAPGISIEQARAEVSRVATRMAETYPATNAGRGADLVSGIGLSPDQRASLKKFLGLMLVTVGLLLAISCGNIANLLLSRAAGRRREVAIRLALGAARGRLVRQLLTESLMLCSVAAVIGALLAPWTVSLLLRLMPPGDSAFGAPVQVNAGVLLFTLAISVATGLLFGLAPALSATRTNIGIAVKGGGESSLSSGRGRFRAQNFLVAAQVALSLVLLIGAGLILRTMQHILALDFGFRTERVLLASMDLSSAGYNEERARLFYSQIVERVSSMAGVESASLSKTYPARGWGDRRSIFYEGQEPPQEELRRRSDLGIRVETNTISPGYFRTLGIPVIAGRDFEPADATGAPRVAIVSERLARRLWGAENPLGKRFAVPGYEGPQLPPVQVVGVARDYRHRSLLTEPPLLLYMPLRQQHEVFVSLEIRTASDPAQLAAAVRAAVGALDRNLPLYDVKTLDSQVATSLWQQRSAAGLIGVFSALALVIAGTGLYSVMAYSVSRRTRDLGIRMALGADRRKLLRMVMGEGLKVVLSGVAVGIAAALSLNRFIAGFLYGITPTDVLTYGAVTALLIVVSLAASYYPARAATRVDPLAALRHE